MMGDACAALGAVIDGCAWLDPAGREVLCEAWPSLAWFQQAGADLPPSVLSSGLATFANFARDVCDDDDSDSGYGSQGLPTSEAFDAAGLIAAIWRVVGAAAATAPDLLEGAWDGNSVRPGLTAGLVAVTYLQGSPVGCGCLLPAEVGGLPVFVSVGLQAPWRPLLC